ncbi:MAG TPA: sugar kinase [Actinomycetota bacterium]|nr:sugar kinase [Actinomycetota bacterium]
MKDIRLVAVGECMVELFSEDPVPVDRAERFSCSFGGDALQAATAAANLGTPSGVATVVGDDPFAEALLSWLRRCGMSTDLVVRRAGFTGLYLISLDGAGERSFAYYRKGSAASTLDRTDVAWPEAPQAVLVSGITQAVSKSSRGAAIEAARRTRDAGGLVVFDVNYRPRLWEGDTGAAREAFEEILPLCHVVRAAAPEETTIVADEEDAAEAARSLSARGPSVVLVGCGAGGAVVAADGTVERIDPLPVHCIDTTGAGDALTGGFIHGLLNGMPPSAAARVGVAAGSLTVTRRGGGPSIPNGEEVRALVEDMRSAI